MGCTLPILGVTGNLLPDDVTYFKAQGANQVFGKPLNLSRFEGFMREQDHYRVGEEGNERSLDSIT
jgi:hypothetical protein